MTQNPPITALIVCACSEFSVLALVRNADVFWAVDGKPNRLILAKGTKV